MKRMKFGPHENFPLYNSYLRDKNNCIMIEQCVQSRITNVRLELRLV